MRVQTSLLLLAVVGVLGAARGTPTRPKYIGCVDSSECGAWECCVLGGGRFSIPKCAPLADVGAICRGAGDADAARPINTTVYYPDGQTVSLPAVFLYVCPCAPGLACTLLPGAGGPGGPGAAEPACTAPVDHEDNEV